MPLNPDQIEQLFTDARLQAEAQTLAARVNLVRAEAAQAAGDAEIERLKGEAAQAVLANQKPQE